MARRLPIRLIRMDSAGIVEFDGRMAFFSHCEDAENYAEWLQDPAIGTAHVLRMMALDVLLKFETLRNGMVESGAVALWGPAGDAVLLAARKLQEFASGLEGTQPDDTTKRDDKDSHRHRSPPSGAEAA